MKILVFGGSGMLGHKLVQSLQRDFDVRATLRGGFSQVADHGIFDPAKTIENVDVTDPGSARRVIEDAKPDVVINAVGIIKQLPSSKDVITSLTVNSIFPQRLAEMASEFDFRLFGISTDCVFVGSKGMYTEDDPPDALDLYGRSKQFGEVTGPNCLTLRTSIIGRELGSSHSLVDWFLSNGGGKVRGYVNAIYSGFPTVVIADIIRDLITDHKDLSGLYHLSSEPINKYDLLQLIRDRFGADIEIDAFEDFQIDRSLDSTRFRSATGFSPPAWDQMIDQMAADPTPYDKWKHELS